MPRRSSTYAAELTVLPSRQDKRSILELYRAVPSPPIDPNSVDSLDNASPLAKDRIAAALENDPADFLTELYPYQKVRPFGSSSHTQAYFLSCNRRLPSPRCFSASSPQKAPSTPPSSFTPAPSTRRHSTSAFEAT